MQHTIKVAFGGDVMLGRFVAEALASHGAAYPFKPVSRWLHDYDLSIVNLECVLTSSHRHWSGAPKEFYFGAPVRGAAALAEAGIKCVSLANNHCLDFDVAGLRDTLAALGRHGIAHAGAGLNLSAALRPAQFELESVKLAMVAFCDHQPDFAATVSRAGIAYLDMTDEKSTIAAWSKQLGALLSRGVHWPILSLHWGPSLAERPTAHYRRLAHAAIDMGWRIVFGHSAHIFQGVEIYGGCPIIYAAGDLMDDYFVDPEIRNDEQLLFELGLTRTDVEYIHLHPVVIDAQQVRPAEESDFESITHRITNRCSELGTRVRRRGTVLMLDRTETHAAPDQIAGEIGRAMRSETSISGVAAG